MNLQPIQWAISWTRERIAPNNISAMKMNWPGNTTAISAALLVAIATLTGCVQDDPYERPSEAEDIVDDEILERIEEAGQEVYGGSTPPDIEASYEVRDGEIVFDERWQEEAGGDWCDATWTFTQTENPDRYESQTVLEGDCSGESEGDAVYISGTDRCFSLYSRDQGEFEGCERDTIRVISGCLTDEGIDDFGVAQIATDMSGDDCENLVDDRQMNGVDYLRLFHADIATKVE